MVFVGADAEEINGAATSEAASRTRGPAEYRPSRLDRPGLGHRHAQTVQRRRVQATQASSEQHDHILRPARQGDSPMVVHPAMLLIQLPVVLWPLRHRNGRVLPESLLDVGGIRVSLAHRIKAIGCRQAMNGTPPIVL
jgi:hypothetical protein